MEVLKDDGRMILKNKCWNPLKEVIIRDMLCLGVCEMTFIIYQFGTIESISSLSISDCNFAILDLIVSNAFDEDFILGTTHSFVECTSLIIRCKDTRTANQCFKATI